MKKSRILTSIDANGFRQQRHQRRALPGIGTCGLAGLLLLSIIPPVFAQTNSVKASGPSNRYLMIVQTSRSMERRADETLKVVQDLLTSSMSAQLRRGDTFGLWTFNEALYAGRFPLQEWSPESQRAVAMR